MVSELAIVDREAEKYRAGALKKLMSESNLTSPLSSAKAELSIFDEENPYRQTVLAIEGLGEYLVRREAEEICLRENQDEEQPHITVISKDYIGVEVKKETGVDSHGLPVDEGVPGVEITLYGRSGKPGVPDEKNQQTKTTDKDGLVLFNVGDFMPTDGVCVEVYMTMVDPQGRYQRKDYGFCHMEGGTDPVRVYVEADTGDPYLVSLKFEDLDMTVMDEGMYATNGDTQEYDINGEVEMNGRTDVQCRVQLLDKGAASESGGNETVLIDAVIKPNGSTRFSSKKQWLNLDLPESEPALRGGHQLEIRTTVETLNGNAVSNGWSVVPAFKNMNGDVVNKWLRGSMEKSDDPPSKSYLDTFVGSVGFKIPSGVPVLGGSEISIANLTDIKPFSEIKALKYVKFQVDLPNRIMIGINFAMLDPQKEGRVYSNKGMQEIEKRQEVNSEKASGSESKWKQGVGDVEAVQAAGKWAKSFSFGLTPFAHLIGSAVYVPDGDYITATFDIKAGILFDICYDSTFYPYPKIYVNFNTMFRIQLGFDLGCEMDLGSSLTSKNVRWSPGVGFFMGFHFEFTVTAGAGIKGVLSAGVRGAIWIDVSDTLPIRDQDDPMTIGARVEVFFDSLFFKWSAIIIQWTSQ